MFSFIRPLTTGTAVLLAASLSAATFVFDLSQPLGVAGGIPYVALPLLGLLAREPRAVIWFTVAGTIMTIAGMLFSPSGGSLPSVLLNRGMSVALLWAVAAIAVHHLAIGDRLRHSLEEQASRDPLTGLFNRRHVFGNVKAELRRYQRYQEQFSLILIDADHFKRINDQHGHCAGDAVLRRIADTCQQAVRETDVVGRFGGEEFIIVLPHTAAAAAKIVAERIRRDMRHAALKRNGKSIGVTLSLGVAETGPGAESFDDLLAAADRALYAAKQAGRNQVASATPPVAAGSHCAA